MEDPGYDYKVEGEVIKLIHGEFPAVRWACGGCGEDSCAIFYEPDRESKLIECDSCDATNLVRKH